MALGSLQRPEVESDEELVVRARRGDANAFDAIYQRFFKRVYVFVDKRLRNTADTEETVQEVFMNIFNSLGSYRGESLFAAWVFGLTRRTIAARFKRKRHPTIPLFEEDEDGRPTTSAASTLPSPAEAYDCHELLSRMEEKLDRRLTSEQKTLFRLHHLEDRPISEIAEVLDKTEDSVKSNLYRARKILLAR